MSDGSLYCGLERIWLSGTAGVEIDGPALIQEIADQIAENYGRLNSIGCAGSSATNWRWFANAEYDRARNTSAETIVEREIIRLTQGLGTWANQIPTNSNMCEGNNSPGHIDLGHRCTDRSFELIELKVASNDPYEAALQIIRYGLTYALFRRIPALTRSNHQTTRKLFEATAIHLRVLAPARYYYQFGKLATLESAVSEGLDYLLEGERWKMDFAYLQFPEWFWPANKIESELLERALVGRAPLHHLTASAATTD
jgi:hypothetical protein